MLFSPNFVSIISTDNSRYQVILISFPNKHLVGRENNKENAEKTARLFAQVSEIPFVPENTSVITLLPQTNNKFLPVELTADGKILGQGTAADRISAIAQATLVAASRELPVLLPE